MSDRTNGYIPDRLFNGGTRHVVEVAPPRDGRLVLGQETIGAPDELNRDAHWRWADVSGDGTHWSHFRGHQVQIDIEFHTANRREVNDWKGRDEIRAEGTWTLALARQRCWEGYLRHDPLDQLLDIRCIAYQLLNHDAIDWRLEKPAAEQIAGRRVYYGQTPAVVSSTCVLSQGCVMLRPVGVDQFPASVHALDRGEDDPYERDELKVELLCPQVWWWRDRAFGDES
ncbi:hypothetical protein OG481_02310 [Streptomyces longwoodensis]|uniref:hypothetical protein n=1 Tax=Streptomyces longwoodensis TaxID=68231 RepID=UPI002DD99CBF|nr:hypothetical protein [Streptomyces longwoodensis]WRY87427.1 hypothetical protein OG481_02310 [Streptomyces longwoodensis]